MGILYFLEIYFTNNFSRQVVSLNSLIQFKVMWRRFGYLEKNVLGEASIKVLASKKHTIPILSMDSEHVADLFVVLGSASQDSGDFSLSESNSPRGNENDNLLLTNDCSKEDQSNDSNGNDDRLNLYACEEESKENDNEALHGLFYVGRLESSTGNSSYILTFTTFWSDENISTRFPVDNNFNFLHVSTFLVFLEIVFNRFFFKYLKFLRKKVIMFLSLFLVYLFLNFHDNLIRIHRMFVLPIPF